jgi:hypothetical protein
MNGWSVKGAALAAAGFLAVAQGTGFAAEPAPEGARDFSGVWWTETYTPRILPMDGSAIPFTEEGAAQYEMNQAQLRSGELEDHSRVWCSPDGLPRIWQQPYPFRIVQTAEEMVILYERNAMYRIIPIGLPVGDINDLFPYFAGNAYGAWDGDSFTTEVLGFKTYTTFLDDTGLPSTFDLHVAERMTKIDDTHLEVIVTITDPAIYSQPWDARFVFTKRDDIRHFDFWVCGEEHRDISSVEGVTP